MCAFNNHRLCVLCPKIGSSKIKNVSYIFHLVHISLIGFSVSIVNSSRQGKNCLYPVGVNLLCSTLSVFAVYFPGAADNLTNRINGVFLLSIENFNIWSSLSYKEVIQTECIIIFKRVCRNVWKSENVILPLGHRSDREDGSVVSLFELLSCKFLDGKETDDWHEFIDLENIYGGPLCVQH